jgi:hypothetical protein
MAEPAGPAGPDDSGSGIIGFLSGSRNLIATIATLIGAVSGLVLALNKAGIIGGDDPDVVSGTTTEPTVTEKPPGRLFPEARRPNGNVYYDGETMYVKTKLPRQRFLHLADLEDPLEDVSLRGRIAWVSGASDYGAGFVCRYANAANYYLLSVLSDGRYNILRYRAGKPVSLTGGIQRSSAVRDGANEVTARCVGRDPVSVRLIVNGETLASKTDGDGIESGNVGIRVGTDESVATFRFDGVALRYL